MDLVASIPVTCPWCGSPTDVAVDRSAGSQEFVEDCGVCCSPITVRVDCDPLTWELLSISVAREND
jgi:hypothetical protein